MDGQDSIRSRTLAPSRDKELARLLRLTQHLRALEAVQGGCLLECQ